MRSSLLSLDSGAGLRRGCAGVEVSLGHSSGMSGKSLDTRAGTSVQEKMPGDQRGRKSHV